MTKRLTEIASEIVKTQLSMTPMSAVDIATSLREVFRTLQGMQKSEAEGIDLETTRLAEELPPEMGAPKISSADSIQKDKVICLECGKEARQLTAKHLRSHGMSPREYRQKYGFTMRTPLAAKSLTKARSKAASKRGLPENLVKFIESKRQRKTAAPAASVEETMGKKVQTKLRKRAKRV